VAAYVAHYLVMVGIYTILAVAVFGLLAVFLNW